jgi:CRISPR/Cas system-associated protein Csm6
MSHSWHVAWQTLSASDAGCAQLALHLLHAAGRKEPAVITVMTAAAAFLLLSTSTAACRLATLVVVSGLYSELMTGSTISQQAADHPFRVLFVGLLFAFASYAPVIK